MRTLITALRFVAIVNFLAIAGFAAWLWASGRLDRDRIAALRDLLEPTRAQLDAKAADEAAGAARSVAESQDAQRRLDPALPSGAVVARTELAASRAILVQRTADDDVRRLMEQLEVERTQLDAREAALEAERAAWNDEVSAERERRVDEQFAKTVRQYESAPPKVAKEWILELDRRGELDRVVAYIDAMQPRAASKILREFEGESEERLATDLLERLRTFGNASRGAEVAPHVRPDASADAREPDAPPAGADG